MEHQQTPKKIHDFHPFSTFRDDLEPLADWEKDILGPISDEFYTNHKVEHSKLAYDWYDESYDNPYDDSFLDELQRITQLEHQPISNSANLNESKHIGPKVIIDSYSKNEFQTLISKLEKNSSGKVISLKGTFSFVAVNGDNTFSITEGAFDVKGK